MDTAFSCPLTRSLAVSAVLGCLCGVAVKSQDGAHGTAQTYLPLRTEALGTFQGIPLDMLEPN